MKNKISVNLFRRYLHSKNQNKKSLSRKNKNLNKIIWVKEFILLKKVIQNDHVQSQSKHSSHFLKSISHIIINNIVFNQLIHSLLSLKIIQIINRTTKLFNHKGNHQNHLVCIRISSVRFHLTNNPKLLKSILPSIKKLKTYSPNIKINSSINLKPNKM